MASLLVSFAATAAAFCEPWCSKHTCNLAEYCGDCTATNNICQKNRPCLASYCASDTILEVHRMCNEDQTCAEDGCTCDDFTTLKVSKIPPSPPPFPPNTYSPPPATPAYPPATCDLEVITDLKAKLSSMISDQEQTNAKLAKLAFPRSEHPFAPPISPSPPPPPPELGACVGLYAQCGGKAHTGSTTCCKGSCTYQNPWYSQCRSPQ